MAGNDYESGRGATNLGVTLARELDRCDAFLPAAFADVAVKGAAVAELRDLVVDATRGLLVDRPPRPFVRKFTPRHQRASSLLRRIVVAAPPSLARPARQRLTATAQVRRVLSTSFSMRSRP